MWDRTGTSGRRASEALDEKYDVSTVPRIYLLDASGVVIAKDIDPVALAKLLEQ